MTTPSAARLCATHNEWCPTGECRWCPVGTVAPAVPPKLEPDFSTMSDVGSRMNTTGRNVVFYCSSTLFCDAPTTEKIEAAVRETAIHAGGHSYQTDTESCGNLSHTIGLMGKMSCQRVKEHDGVCRAYGEEWPKTSKPIGHGLGVCTDIDQANSADTFSSQLDNPYNDKFCGNRHPSKQLECNLTPGHDGECSAIGGDWFHGSPTHRKQLAFRAYPPSELETGFIPAQVHGSTLCMYPSWRIGDNRWCNRKRHHAGPCGPPDAPFWSATRPTMPIGENQTVWTAKHMESLNRRDPPASLVSPHAMVLAGMDIITTPSTLSSSQWTDMVLQDDETGHDYDAGSKVLMVLAELNKILDDKSMSATGQLHYITKIVKAFSGQDDGEDAGDTPEYRAALYGEKP